MPIKSPPSSIYDNDPWYITPRIKGTGPPEFGDRTAPSSISDALARSQRDSASTIDDEQLKAYILQETLKKLQPPAEPQMLPRGMTIPPVIDDAPRSPASVVASMTGSLSALGRPANDIANYLRSKEGAEAIQGMASGTGIGVVRPSSLGFDFFKGAKPYTKLFASNLRLSPEMDNLTGTIDTLKKEAHISHVFTNKSYQGMGAAEESIKGLMEQLKAQGIETASLESVGSALDFYQKLGFKATERPEWVGAVIPMKGRVGDILETLNKRNVESRFPAERIPKTKAEIEATTRRYYDVRPMVEGRRGPAHAKFEYYDPEMKQKFFTLEQPIRDAFGNELHPTGSTLSSRTLRDYGLDIRPNEIQAARYGATPEGIEAYKQKYAEFRKAFNEKQAGVKGE